MTAICAGKRIVRIGGKIDLNISELLGKRILFFDGAMGSLLQERGAKPGENTDIWNLTRPDEIRTIHEQYLKAGADIILANTFGANRLKLAGTGFSTEEIVFAGVKNAKKAAERYGAFVALDVAPTGKLLQPLGDLTFDEAVGIFREIVIAGEKAGADLIQIETMSDTYELKAAVLAAKENTGLPVFATVTMDERGKLLTGGDVKTVVALLEGLGVDALGMNCGLGPLQMKPMVKEFLKEASLPVIVNPNAGLPRQDGGKTVYDVEPEEFARYMEEYAQEGAWLLGGCCGTTPEYIKRLVERCKDKRPEKIQRKNKSIVTSYSGAVEIGKGPVIIGERINPTGKARLKQALREKDMDYILQEAFSQEEKGAHILDINVGLPEIAEHVMLPEVVRQVQSVIDLPLQLDTADPAALEQGLRYYNGKALVNSVNGKRESMETVFPLVKKYGGVVVGLTLDEEGIPETAEGRLAVAEKIVKTAEEYGISTKDILIDVLCMTVSSNPKSAETVLKALRLVKEKLGVGTILGVSNISIGLPRRDIINAAFYTMALEAGLDCGIINPNAEGMMNAYHAYKALSGLDENFEGFIAAYKDTAAAMSGASVKKGEHAQAAGKEETSSALQEAVQRGQKERAADLAAELVKETDPLVLINRQLIPALDRVGKGFEAGTVFLPQLLMSAEAAKAAFESVKKAMVKEGKAGEKKGQIVIATVKGDVHDIGKNIVKVLLENYGFSVCDLGKDVAPEKIAETVDSKKILLVGLSALMTTTVSSMKETIELLRRRKPDCKIMVGGAVLTEDYAKQIGADYYAKDAMASVHYAQKILNHSVK